MDTKQFNLKIPLVLADKADQFVREYGYRNIQDLALEGIRDKIYGQYDEDFSAEEIKLIENLIRVESGNKLVSEKELNKVLLE